MGVLPLVLVARSRPALLHRQQGPTNATRRTNGKFVALLTHLQFIHSWPHLLDQRLVLLAQHQSRGQHANQCTVVQSKIQELSDQVTELTAKNASSAQQMQELAQVKTALEDTLRNQGSQLKRISTEYMVLRARSVSNVFLPSSTIQFDPSEDVILKYPASTSDGVSEHIIVPSTDIQQCDTSLCARPDPWRCHLRHRNRVALQAGRVHMHKPTRNLRRTRVVPCLCPPSICTAVMLCDTEPHTFVRMHPCCSRLACLRCTVSTSFGSSLAESRHPPVSLAIRSPAPGLLQCGLSTSEPHARLHHDPRSHNPLPGHTFTAIILSRLHNESLHTLHQSQTM